MSNASAPSRNFSSADVVRVIGEALSRTPKSFYICAMKDGSVDWFTEPFGSIHFTLVEEPETLHEDSIQIIADWFCEDADGKYESKARDDREFEDFLAEQNKIGAGEVWEQLQKYSRGEY